MGSSILTAKRFELPELSISDINWLSRQILHKSMNLRYTYEACLKEPVSPTRLVLFKKNPEQFGPIYDEIRLDMTCTTRHSEWNLAVSKVLAQKARSVTSSSSGSSDSVVIVDWERLFANRIDRIISDARKLKINPVSNKLSKAKRATLLTKFRRRKRITSVMITQCQAVSDEEGIGFWTYIEQSLDILTYHGMSDEEPDKDDNKEPFKCVFGLDFRHPAFNSLFQHVDETPALYPDFFPPTGAKRIKRIFTHISVTRAPAPQVPASFFREGYDHQQYNTIDPTISALFE
ncbi:hypothetical protein LENED_009724 [Lentinula edodes]|uniref:Uncharacterized protein n=1 Tax=Lentinula edodes TaxID=5353 RepID=A0A1Q3EKS6_LENED|nr:hypothetical protein LENED_009724 [Lentinula edodes]